MKNILNYYYGLYPDEILYKDEKYFFEVDNSKYVLETVDRPLSDIDALYKINKEMLDNNILVHEIKLNKENKIITYINNLPYVLMELFINIEAKVSLPEVCYINNNTINLTYEKILGRSSWITLWETKNDYFEALINEIGKKFPNLCTYANYYIGLAENAISYVKSVNSIKDNALLGICHKRMDTNSTLYELYHPFKFIFDYRIRDASEYIKSLFFKGEDAYKIVEEYFLNNYLSFKEAVLFYGRLLYPSYFFDSYDDIINENMDEEKIEQIILKSQEYEIFLTNINLYISKLYNKQIPNLDWLIKKSYL